MDNSFSVAGQDAGQQKLIQDFWDKKARNYFTRQFGTPDDPIARGIASKQIKGTALEEKFPEYMLDQIAAGKTRVKDQKVLLALVHLRAGSFLRIHGPWKTLQSAMTRLQTSKAM